LIQNVFLPPNVISVDFSATRERLSMQARILRIGIGVALLLVGFTVGTHTSTSIRADVHGDMRASVPAGYGRVVAGDSASLWFEDETNTLRQVNIPEGKTIFTITRQR
jgi:hypothetical protein